MTVLPVPPPAQPPLWQRLRQEVVLPLLLLWVVTTFVGTVARVDGNSMNPTLHTGQALWLVKYSRWLHAWGLTGLPYQRGDIVIFKAPAESEYAWQTFSVAGQDLRHRPYNIKRVIGLPGDSIALHDGAVWLNGKRLNESYASGDAAQDEDPVTVPPEHVYVLGDNRQLGESVDSRFYGAVSAKDIAGKVVYSLWAR